MNENSQDEPAQHRHHKMLPIWFFIGVLLLTYGVIILWTSLSTFHQTEDVVLAKYHAGVWGGVLLIALGGGYTLKFWPRRGK